MNRSAVGVVVLGMARSGTSAVTGMFVSAGFYIGSGDELMGPTRATRPATSRTSGSGG